MNAIVEIEVKEINVAEQAAGQAQTNAITELDIQALSLVGGGSFSPSFA
jgi:hypothetical protein